MIQVNDISFYYSSRIKVLSNISFNIDKANTLAIVGVSGCGKSTLLRIISGILPIQNQVLNGDVLLNGKKPNEYINSGKLAFMFQEATLMPNLTVRENIELPLKIKGIKNDHKVNELIATVGLVDYANYLPKQLSGGMKTRVALARSFVTEPEILLLDEPFSALDIAWKSKLYIELEKLRNQYNTTVIIVTHDVQEAILLSNNVMVLNRSGSIELEKKMNDSHSVINRLQDITNYMSQVYEDDMLPIQEAIINGQQRIYNEKLDTVYTA